MAVVVEAAHFFKKRELHMGRQARWLGGDQGGGPEHPQGGGPDPLGQNGRAARPTPLAKVLAALAALADVVVVSPAVAAVRNTRARLLKSSGCSLFPFLFVLLSAIVCFPIPNFSLLISAIDIHF